MAKLCERAQLQIPHAAPMADALDGVT